VAAESADSCAVCSTFQESYQFKRSVNAYLLGIKCQDIGYTEKRHDIGYKYNQEGTVVWWNSRLAIERAGVRMFSRFMRRGKLASAFVLGKTARM
jgi:hypothetical protein